VRHVEELTVLLNDRLRDHDRAFWVTRAGKAGVPCAPINGIDEVFAEPQVQHNAIVTQVEHPTAGEIPMIGIPITLRSASLAPSHRPPRLGEHTHELMWELAGRRARTHSSEAVEGPAA
jgi:crotonobetainyl-CoA:carnitine CoA-transferase CaiB-like acyl-CoA transferase